VRVITNWIGPIGLWNAQAQLKGLPRVESGLFAVHS